MNVIDWQEKPHARSLTLDVDPDLQYRTQRAEARACNSGDHGAGKRAGTVI